MLSRISIRLSHEQCFYGPGFPGETFRVLKEKETRQYGEYRTKRLVPAAWNAGEEG